MISGGELGKAFLKIAEEVQKVGSEKPGSGFDGPWNKNAGNDIGREVGKLGDGNPQSGFDGPWNDVEKPDVLTNQNLENLTERDLKNLGEDYNEEIRNGAGEFSFKETDVSSWEKVSSEDCVENRKEFGEQRERLVAEWEKVNGRDWPTYSEDVYTESGKLLRKAGQKYDAHHIQPLEFGGKNAVDNIVPMHANDHHDKQGIHRPGGSYDQIAQNLRE